MSISEVIESKRVERGITIAELSRRTNISYDTLSRALKGKTELKGDQFLNACHELGLDFSDFDAVEN